MGFNVDIKYKVKRGRKPPKKMQQQLRVWQNTTTELLHREPGPVKTPIRWTTPKQRRFVMGFVLKRDADGNIIRTVRSGRVRKWGVFVDYDAIDQMQDFAFDLMVFMATISPKGVRLGRPPKDGVLVSITNPAPYQTYVTGTSQQGFHIDTGWIHAPTIINKQRRELDGIFEDSGIL